MDFPPAPGGISAHVQQLATTYAQIGHQVTVLTRLRDGQPKKQEENGVTVLRIRLRFGALSYGLQNNRRVQSLLPQLRPDVIHIHGMMPLEWYNIPEVPLVYTNHTSGYLRRIKKGGRRRMAMLKRHFQKVDLFLAPSNELLEIPFPIRAPKQFIPNGVSAARFVRDNEARRATRSEFNIEDEATVAIITRRLVDKNGVIYLAKATAKLKHKVLHFIVIGDGPERSRVEEEFCRNCGERVHFLGNMGHDEIIRYYSAADFSILPSLLEATSISGLEAMAASLPLVGTEVGGIPELIKNGENGYLCNPADPDDLAAKIELLLEKDLQKMGRASRKMVEERFDWQRIAEQTLACYKNFLFVQ